jgi:hypothetical protein
LRRKAVVVTVVVLLIVAVGSGGYLQLYRPSQQLILSAPKPIPQNKQYMMPVTPLDQLPEPDQTRFASMLRDAAHAIEPRYRIVEERMYLWPGGWVEVRQDSGEYLRNDFGFHQQARAETQVDGQGVDYVIWGSRNWLRHQFDDRIVVAAAYSESVSKEVRERLLGYFVMRPGP